MLAASAAGLVESPEWIPMVWVEDRVGAIARGLADSVTAIGAQVRLGDEPQIAEGDLVSLRLCLERGAPTEARRARITWVRQTGGSTVECGLEWIVPAS
jgi:hypothetical protein